MNANVRNFALWVIIVLLLVALYTLVRPDLDPIVARLWAWRP
jgi:hypothetical protein